MPSKSVSTDLWTLFRPLTTGSGKKLSETRTQARPKLNPKCKQLRNSPEKCLRSNFEGWCKRETTRRLLSKPVLFVFMFRATKIRENAWHFDFDLFSRRREGLAWRRAIFTQSERLLSRNSSPQQEMSWKSQSKVPENSCTGFYPEKIPINRLEARNQLPLFWSLSIAERVFAVKDDCMIKAARRSFLRRLFCKSNFLSLRLPSPGAASKAGTIAVQVKFLRSGLQMGLESVWRWQKHEICWSLQIGDVQGWGGDDGTALGWNEMELKVEHPGLGSLNKYF